MQEVISFLKDFNIQTIISLAVLLFIFSANIKGDIKAVSNKIDALDKDVQHMNTRISRVEGTVYGTKVYEAVQEKKS